MIKTKYPKTVLHALREARPLLRVAGGKYTYVCNAVDVATLPSSTRQIAKNYINSSILRLPLVSSWLLRSNSKHYHVALRDNFTTYRLAWVDYMIEQLEKELVLQQHWQQ